MRAASRLGVRAIARALGCSPFLASTALRGQGNGPQARRVRALAAGQPLPPLPPPRSLTQRDIALACHVDRSTVSLALRAYRGYVHSPTARTIRAYAAAHGYPVASLAGLEASGDHVDAAG